MSTTPRRPAALSYTFSVLRAAFEAAEDAAWMQRYTRRAYEFRLLAAANLSTPELPLEGWHDLGRSIRIQSLPQSGELRVSLQAEGYAALQRVAGHAARLESLDGIIDVRFRFDSAGGGMVVLTDSPGVRQALACCFLSLLDATDSFDDAD